MTWRWLSYLGMLLLTIFVLELGREEYIFRKARDKVQKNPEMLSKFENINDFKKLIDKELLAQVQTKRN